MRDRKRKKSSSGEKKSLYLQRRKTMNNKTNNTVVTRTGFVGAFTRAMETFLAKKGYVSSSHYEKTISSLENENNSLDALIQSLKKELEKTREEARVAFELAEEMEKARNSKPEGGSKVVNVRESVRRYKSGKVIRVPAYSYTVNC